MAGESPESSPKYTSLFLVFRSQPCAHPVFLPTESRFSRLPPADARRRRRASALSSVLFSPPWRSPSRARTPHERRTTRR
ncbi:hypothetical protein HMPREF9440_00360, partial [Sutterella parvirubra YIT 11816]